MRELAKSEISAIGGGAASPNILNNIVAALFAPFLFGSFLNGPISGNNKNFFQIYADGLALLFKGPTS